MRKFRWHSRFISACVLALLVSKEANAEESKPDDDLSLGDIFELSKKVSGVSKSEESLAEAPMSVFVIEQKDL